MATQKTEAKVVVSAEDKASGPLAVVEARFRSMLSPVDALKSRLGGLGSTTFGGLGQQIGGIRGQLALLGIGGLGAMYGGLKLVRGGFDAVVETAEKIDRISDIGGRLNLNAEQFQVFDKIAKAGGSSVEELGGAFQKLRLNMMKAQEGSAGDMDKMSTSLARFGLSFNEAKAMAPIDLMKRIGVVWSQQTSEIADGYKELDARNIFGKTGVTQIKIIEQLGVRYDELRDSMRSAGLLVTEDQKKQFGDVFKTYEKSRGAMQGLKMAFGLQMMPVFDQVAHVWEDRMKANRAAMMPGVKALANVISVNVKPFLDDMDGLADKTSGVFKWLAKLAGLVGWDKIIFGGALLLISPLILATGSLAFALGGVLVTAAAAAVPAVLALIAPIGSAVFAMNVLGVSGAAAWALVLGPLLLIGAAIAVVAYLIYANWGGIVAFAGGVWQGFVDSMAPVAAAFDPITSAIGSVVSWMGSLFGSLGDSQGSFSAWASAGQAAGDIVARVFKALLTPITLVIDAIKLVVAGFNWLGTDQFKFNSSTTAMYGGGTPAASTGALPAGQIATGRQDVGGKLDIRITADGKAQVDRVESNSNTMDFNVNGGGMYGVGA